MVRAVWNGAVLAESEDTVVVEGNHYFPRAALKAEYFRESDLTSRCAWKGRAQYLTVEVDGRVNRDAAWYYADPSRAARRLRGRVAFWHGVAIEGDGGGRRRWFRRQPDRRPE